MKRLFLGSILAASLAIVLAACGGGETETIVVKEEVIREVPVEVVVEKEVIKEVMVPGETVVVKEEVIKEVQVAGETVVVTKEVPVEVVKEVVKQVEVVREVEIPVETFVMTKKRHPLIGDLEGPTVLHRLRAGQVQRGPHAGCPRSPRASCRLSRSAWGLSRWSCVRLTRSASTAAPGTGGSSDPTTAPTPSARSGTTGCCTGTPRGPR